MLEVHQTDLAGVLEIRAPKFGDHRGFFSEVWSRAQMSGAGLDFDFVQDNHSLSVAAGVLRGLHYQTPPAAQDKLVRVSRGSIYDVAVDIRRGSPTFGRWVGVTLSAERWNQLLVPKGFAHGFLTMEPDSEVQYKVTAPYSPKHDRAIRFDDPDIGVDWPFEHDRIQLSDKDRAAPFLKDVDTGFTFQ